MSYKCYILCIYNYSILLWQLLELFQDETIFFIGIGVGGDISKISRDFHYISTIKNIKPIINLSKFPRASNTVKKGVISLQKLTKIFLKEDLMKKNIVHSSK